MATMFCVGVIGPSSMLLAILTMEKKLYGCNVSVLYCTVNT